MSKPKLTETYIEEVNNIHNFKYDYSLVEYKNAHTKIKIICPIHGVFEQTPHNHRYCGCNKCGKLFNKNELIKKLKKIHNNKYEYVGMDYIGMNFNIKILCKEHGYFEQKAINHLKGQGCPKCAKNSKKDLENIIKKMNELHNNKYDYSLMINVSVKEKIKIICPIHGVFEQILNNHLQGHGCPICNNSKGEQLISKYLLNRNIFFERQKKFKNCRDKRLLPFDFYLPEYNLCIEYDGKQHFESVENWGGQNNLENIKKHDKIKNNFCNDNDIDILRISYNDKNIFDKLKLYFNQYNINNKK